MGKSDVNHGIREALMPISTAKSSSSRPWQERTNQSRRMPLEEQTHQSSTAKKALSYFGKVEIELSSMSLTFDDADGVLVSGLAVRLPSFRLTC